MEAVIDAMFEKTFHKGDYVIREGEDGDNFFVLDSGTCDCLKKQADGSEKVVLKYQHGMINTHSSKNRSIYSVFSDLLVR